MLGFTEREVGHFTLRKWFALFEQYKKYHNFRVNGGTFEIEKTEEEKLERLWNPFERGTCAGNALANQLNVRKFNASRL